MQTVASLKICTLMRFFCQKSFMLETKNSTEELYVMTLKNDAKFEKKLTGALKNDMRNLANFDPTLKVLKFAL